MLGLAVGFEYPVLAFAGVVLAFAGLLVYYMSRRELSRLLSYMGGEASRLLTLLASARLASFILLALASGGVYTTVVDYVNADTVSGDVLASVKAIHVILIDDSRSMSYRDMGRERIDLARGIVESYLEHLGPGDRVIIYRFYSVVEELCEGAPQDCMGSLEKLSGGERYSALGTALGEIATISAATGLPVVGVVISDGGYNYGPNPLDVASGMSGMRGVALVRVGGDQRGEIMREVAERAGWLYYHVTGDVPEGLVDDLASQVYGEAKVRAVSTPEGLVPVERRDYTIALILAVAGVLLLALSEVAGP